jgi:hypothetical protein
MTCLNACPRCWRIRHHASGLIEPLPVDFEDAAVGRAAQARSNGSTPITAARRSRHALFVFESLDVVDLAYETFALALLYGDLDGEGFPRFDAIFGGR